MPMLLICAAGAAAAPAWKVQAGAGFLYGEGILGKSIHPFGEYSIFTEALEPKPPEYFDFGMRIQRGVGLFALSVGVRHKLYGAPWAATVQEVQLGFIKRVASPWEALLSGRFGAGMPLDGRDSAHPPSALEFGFLWGLAGLPGRGPVGSHWGLSLGGSIGGEAP